MPNFTYTRDIPNGPNNPSADQPIMQTNANSIDSILDVDLYGFNDNNGGTHQQVTFPLNINPAAPTGISSVVSTKPGSADNTRSQLFFQNSAAIFLLSAIKAFAATNPGTTILNGYGITSVAGGVGGVYTVTLTTALPSSNYLVVANAFSIGEATVTYAPLTTSTFELRTFVNGVASPVAGFSFVVLQA